MSTRPNILLLLTDQHSPHVAGFAGDRRVQTATLDALAGQGFSFDAAYCQAPLCVPSRMALWTGRYAYRCGAWDNGSVLSTRFPTLPGWLAHHGYATAAVGKMHFRGCEQMHGFQHRPYGDLVESRFPAHQPDPLGSADGRWNRHSSGRFPFAGTTTIPESLLFDTLVVRESLSWLLEHRDAHPAQPWFLCVSFSRPHFPLTAPARYVRRYVTGDLELPPLPAGYPAALHPHDRFVVTDFRLTEFSRTRQRYALACYYASVHFVDVLLGDFLEGLRREGALDNTYVVYTSDHGEMGGEHGLWWKRTYYEASARVPLLVHGPGIPFGKRETIPVELVDLFPTFCEWAKVGVPPGVDGETLVSLLNGRPSQRRKQLARTELLGGRPETRFRMVRSRRWKVVDFPDAPPRLFDLVTDPGETEDLYLAPPAEAPLPALKEPLVQSGAWAELGRRYEKERAGRKPFAVHGRGAAQYRLNDGRIVEPDACLYPGAPRGDDGKGSDPDEP